MHILDYFYTEQISNAEVTFQLSFPIYFCDAAWLSMYWYVISHGAVVD